MNDDLDINDVVPAYKYELLSPIQQTYIDWKALNGLITDDDGIRKVYLKDLAKQFGVGVQTFYDQTKHIPNLYELINQRRYVMSGKTRLQKVHETWYLKAAKGDFQHMQLWLANFDPDFKMPQQKVQHDVTDTMAEALAIARQRRRQVSATAPAEGEVIDAETADQNAND